MWLAFLGGGLLEASFARTNVTVLVVYFSVFVIKGLEDG